MMGRSYWIPGSYAPGIVREARLLFKAIEKEGLQGGKRDNHWLYDIGKSHDPGIQQEPSEIWLPQVDTNGNEIAGIRLPHVAVPLGTFTGWNYTVPRLANLDYLAGLVGSFLPFARTRADREVSSDPCPSIAELYRTKEVYLERVRHAAEALVAQRFVRQKDLEAMLEDSARSWDFLMQPSPK
jgi:Alpha/beta hydrolase domain